MNSGDSDAGDGDDDVAVIVVVVALAIVVVPLLLPQVLPMPSTTTITSTTIIKSTTPPSSPPPEHQHLADTPPSSPPPPPPPSPSLLHHQLNTTMETELDDRNVITLPTQDEDDHQEAGHGTHGTTSLSSDHCHIPRSSTQASKRAMTKLAVACCLTTIFLIGEAVGGYLANSIAIMSDSAHLLSDLTSFIVSLVAIYLAMQPASKKMNFGYYRAEVLGAVVSVLIIWVITGVLVYAAIQRVISMEFEVEADTMIIVAAIGVVMNIILGVALHAGQGGHGHSHGHGHGSASTHNPPITSTPDHSQPGSGPGTNINVRAAFIHVLGDLIQSIGVLIAAYIIRFYPQYKIADPICTFIFSLLVIFTTVPILKDLANVLMEGAPPGVDYAMVSSHLTALPGVKMVHSLHVWALTLDKNACVVHLAIDASTDPEVVLRDAQRVIRARHHIFHTTIQVERYEPLLMDNCHQCQPLT